MWVSCRIGTTSHTLETPAFHVFQQPESTIRVSDVQTNNFRIAFGHFEHEDAPEGEKVSYAHYGTRAFIVSLNVATVGMFFWASDPWLHPVYGLADGPESPPTREGTLIVRPSTTYEETSPLTRLDVQNAAIIFGMIARETDKAMVTEYTKGLLLRKIAFECPARKGGDEKCVLPEAAAIR